MTFRRMTDFASVITSTVTLIFLMGILYAQQKENTKEIEKAQAYKERVIQLEKAQVGMRLQQANSQAWQGEFITTFKELVKEIKTTNAEVLRNTYHLQSIEEKVKSYQ